MSVQLISTNQRRARRLTPQQKIIVDASNAIENKTVQFGLDSFKHALEEAKKKATLYSPTPAELAQWREGMPAIWEDLAKSNEEVGNAYKSVKATLKR